MDAAADTFSQFCGASARNPSDFTREGVGLGEGGPLLSVRPPPPPPASRGGPASGVLLKRQRFSTTQRIFLNFFFAGRRGRSGVVFNIVGSFAPLPLRLAHLCL